MSLPQMSLSGAVMIIVIVAVRALAIHKLPKMVFPALWGIVLARLLIPYSLPSAFSVYSLPGRFAPAAETVETMETAQGFRFAPVVPAQNATTTPAAPAVSGAAVSADPWPVIWAFGTLACAAFFALAYFKCRREFRFSLPVDNEYVRRWLGEHRLRRGIEIRQSDRISAPLTYGVFRPVILLPKTADWEDDKTLDYVLAHEYVHIRRFDAAAKLLLTAALCAHWFNPAVWMMYVLANRDIELSCDEAVVRRFGEHAKSAYAMALIRMEEARSGLKAASSPLSSNFSKNAIEERITAIMKIKKTSLVALVAALALVVGVTTAFATSAKPDENTPAGIDTATQVSTMLSLVEQTGMTYYSLDGGITYEAMTAEEYAARFPTPEVEWWTYEEYKEWLENEKAELQSLIGERAWNSGRGEFIWTQEIVDETIAMYEGILEDIKNGMLYSKTVNGEADGIVISMNPGNIAINVSEGPASAADFSEYTPYGLVWYENEQVLFWNGRRVRYFLDGTEIDGGMAIRLEYADAERKGEIDVRAVRARVDNADGSFDPMGPLVGLEQYSQAEFDARTSYPPALEAYAPYGLRYRIHPATGELTMNWLGKPVHSLLDAEKGVWVTNSLRVLDLGPDAVDLEAVYEGGALAGLREVETGTTATSFTAENDSAAEQGASFAGRFAKYAPFGITYEEAESAGGAGNVYLNGRLVSRFADLTPDGGAFTFTSADQGGLIVRTIYDGSGNLMRIETA